MHQSYKIGASFLGQSTNSAVVSTPHSTEWCPRCELAVGSRPGDQPLGKTSPEFLPWASLSRWTRGWPPNMFFVVVFKPPQLVLPQDQMPSLWGPCRCFLYIFREMKTLLRWNFTCNIDQFHRENLMCATIRSVDITGLAMPPKNVFCKLFKYTTTVACQCDVESNNNYWICLTID